MGILNLSQPRRDFKRFDNLKPILYYSLRAVDSFYPPVRVAQALRMQATKNVIDANGVEVPKQVTVYHIAADDLPEPCREFDEIRDEDGTYWKVETVSLQTALNRWRLEVMSLGKRDPVS